MVNLTSTSTCDTVALRGSRKDSTIRKVIFINCNNPSDGGINIASAYALTVAQCLIINCTCFPPDRYNFEGNTRTFDINNIEAMTLNQNQCLKWTRESTCQKCIIKEQVPMLMIGM